MQAVHHFLDLFFEPKSIAVVGASNNPFKMNYRLMENLARLNFKGKIYPVNPNSKEILGVRTFARLQDIKEEIDLIVSAVPASATMDIARDCDAIGAKRLVIITGGFSEGGDQGERLHREIASFIREKGIRTLGPNTLSPVNTANNLVISFNPVRKVKRGGISFAFQSGFYEPKLNWLLSHLRINKMLDLGNKMDVNELDALEYFSMDHDTKVIAMHIESLHGDGRDFFDLLKSVSREKPVIILKAGRTRAGSKAAASHTGSIAGENDVIFDTAIKQAGAIRAQNIDEFFDLAKAFEFLELPKGNRLAIITLSGGEGVMATDACEMNGLELARLSDKTRDRLKKVFPPWEIPLNPFDGGVCMEFHLSDPKTLFEAFSAIPDDENVDFIIMQMPPNPVNFVSLNQNISEETKASLNQQYIHVLLNMNRSGKPFCLWCSAMDTQEMELVELLASHGLPVFQTSERAIKSVAGMAWYRGREPAQRTTRRT
jgi:acyl-CoA synthetase (NDP forming)